MIIYIYIYISYDTSSYIFYHKINFKRFNIYFLIYPVIIPTSSKEYIYTITLRQ